MVQINILLNSDSLLEFWQPEKLTCFNEHGQNWIGVMNNVGQMTINTKDVKAVYEPFSERVHYFRRDGRSPCRYCTEMVYHVYGTNKVSNCSRYPQGGLHQTFDCIKEKRFSVRGFHPPREVVYHKCDACGCTRPDGEPCWCASQNP